MLLVPGAWHGAWCWEDFTPHLTALGWTVHTMDLPSNVDEKSDDFLPSAFDDAEAVRQALAGIDGPTVILAHSYGGVPVSQAVTKNSGVVGIIYLSSYPLEVGESMYDFYGLEMPDPENLKGIAPPPKDPGEELYNDVPVVKREKLVARLSHASHRAWADRLSNAGWRDVPATFIQTDNDHIYPPQMQEKAAARLSAVHHLPSGHSPFVSMPERFAALVTDIAG